MDPQTLRDHLSEQIQSTMLLDEPLSRHTSLRIGGPAWAWIWVKDLENLLKILQFSKEENRPVTLMGGGCNILPKDKGYEGIVLNLRTPFFRRMELGGETTLRVGAGVSLEELVAFTRRKGLGGLEMMTGVPGTVGGAIAVNAGSHDRSIGDQVEEIVFLNAKKEVVRLRKGEIHFEYRASNLANGIILESKLKVAPVNRAQLDEQCRQFLIYKKNTQDLVRPSAGCIFKNPKNGHKTSGELIDLSGLKGLRIGDAQVSEKHANFIVNLGHATSDHVFALIDRVRQRVKKDHRCELELEVRLLA
ncbi:MAG: UDP-N-acetylmuramate dehydrogenase [Candidatus Omnitrophica bacterium]|nr:UDP-N-acetylmuramate dehydrogenase [Candidatus Omnitrophota bacterium]